MDKTRREGVNTLLPNPYVKVTPKIETIWSSLLTDEANNILYQWKFGKSVETVLEK